MTPTRRNLIVGMGATAAVAAVASVGLYGFDDRVAVAAGLAPRDRDLVVLHSRSVDGRALSRALKQTARPTAIALHQTAGLGRTGFSSVRDILGGARKQRLFAVLDSADALVVETLLFGTVLKRRPLAAVPGRQSLIVLTGEI